MSLFFRSSFLVGTASILSAVQANADVIRTSDVTSIVDTNPDGTYTYNYTVINTSDAPQRVDDVGNPDPEGSLLVWPTIVDYEVPIDSPTAVQDVMSPAFWDFEILSAGDYEARFGEPNPFGAPFVVHWFTERSSDFPSGFPIVPTGYNDFFGTLFYENFTDGFIFTSVLGPVDGPYLTSWQDDFRRVGDPPLPGTSFVGGAGTLPFTPLQVPEPGGFLVLASAWLGVLTYRRRAS